MRPAGIIQPAHQAAMFNLHTVIHYDIEPTLTGNIGSFIADKPQLQPENLCLDCDRAACERGGLLNPSKHIQDINIDIVRVNRNNPVAMIFIYFAAK
tara:strand:- start:1115 stop:1405 length:291 start_codon:yes stop_codon:yes gene_type:complete